MTPATEQYVCANRGGIRSGPYFDPGLRIERYAIEVPPPVAAGQRQGERLSIFDKTGVSNRLELALFALRHELFDRRT